MPPRRILPPHRRRVFLLLRLPALLLLHGLGCDHTTWEPVIEALSRRYTVIAPDLLGHGQSDKPHERRYYGAERMPADISTLADHLGLTEYDLVGYSMGGGIAASVAAQDKRVRRVVISGMGEALVKRGGLERRVLDPAALAAGLRAESSEGLNEVVALASGGGNTVEIDLLGDGAGVCTDEITVGQVVPAPAG